MSSSASASSAAASTPTTPSRAVVVTSRSRAHGKLVTGFAGAFTAKLGATASGPGSRKRVTVKTLTKVITSLGKRSKDDAAVDKWASAKRVKKASMSAEHREYFVKISEAMRARVTCSSGDDSHKCSIVALEKWRKAHPASDAGAFPCPTCRQDTLPVLEMRLRYLDANEYFESVPYLSAAALAERVAASTHSKATWAAVEPELFWNAHKHK
jgi:hypothetical protein